MKKIDIARALRDAEYRNSLSPAERALLPSHPAGLSTMQDDALRSVTGGCGPTACNNCPPPPSTVDPNDFRCMDAPWSSATELCN